MTVDVKRKGSLLNKGFEKITELAMINAMDRLLKTVEEKSKEDYLKKKIERPKLPSYIIDSFRTKIPLKTKTEVRGIVFAGGPVAPYTIFVDKGHVFRGGKGSFPGHHFMEAGKNAGMEVSKKFLLEELNKLR